jgi:hypothetical protein
MYYQTKTATPCAFITKDKQRLKQFGQNVYLKNGEEFEIELFNPTQSTVLTKIKINGTYLSGGGLVIKPGQRVFLERYMDEPRKFKFDTYEVDGSSNEVLNAIANNGDVRIEFYEESRPTITYPHLMGGGWQNGWSGINVDSGTPYYGNITYSTNNVSSYYTNTSNFSTNYVNDNVLSLGKRTKSLETGRVEKGGKSNQDFSYVNMNFNHYTCSVSEWKILPNSQKPYESKDIKLYCVGCGVRRKKDSHKFCPICGTKY